MGRVQASEMGMEGGVVCKDRPGKEGVSTAASLPSFAARSAKVTGMGQRSPQQLHRSFTVFGRRGAVYSRTRVTPGAEAELCTALLALTYGEGPQVGQNPLLPRQS